LSNDWKVAKKKKKNFKIGNSKNFELVYEINEEKNGQEYDGVWQKPGVARRRKRHVDSTPENENDSSHVDEEEESREMNDESERIQLPCEFIDHEESEEEISLPELGSYFSPPSHKPSDQDAWTEVTDSEIASLLILTSPTPRSIPKKQKPSRSRLRNEYSEIIRDGIYIYEMGPRKSLL
jgi:hypothetical protein